MTAAEKMAGKKCLLTEGSGGQQQRRRADHSDAKRQACCCHLISASRCYHHKAPERGDLFSFLLFLPNFFLVIFPFFAPLIVFPQKKWCTVKVAAYNSAKYFRIQKKQDGLLTTGKLHMRSSHTNKRKLQCCELQECARAKLSQYSLYKCNVNKKSTNQSDKVWKTHNK